MSTAVLVREIDLVVPPALQDVIAGFGRTEDVCFSPDNRRLAVAGFGRDQIHVLDVVVDELPSGRPSLAVTGIVEVVASSLYHPHGLAFADDDTLVVANRGGDVVVLALPSSTGGSTVVRLTATVAIAVEAHGLSSPGSVVVAPLAPQLDEVLVCNNDAHTVTRHLLDRRDGIRVEATEVALAAGLAIPDGVAVSADRAWLAVSNHATGTVLVYRDRPDLGPGSPPDGVLHDIRYPHGLRFTADGRFLVVADAGAPQVHVFASEDGDWSGDRLPVSSHRVMDEDRFRRGQHNPQEGGPKGLDLDRTGRILVVTSEQQPLGVFDLREVLAGADGAALTTTRRSTHGAGEAARTAVLRERQRVVALEATVADQARRLADRQHALDEQARRATVAETDLAAVRSRLTETDAAVAHEQAIADDLAGQLDAVRASTSWRATAVGRSLSDGLRRLGGRRALS